MLLQLSLASLMQSHHLLILSSAEQLLLEAMQICADLSAELHTACIDLIVLTVNCLAAKASCCRHATCLSG